MFYKVLLDVHMREMLVFQGRKVGASEAPGKRLGITTNWDSPAKAAPRSGAKPRLSCLSPEGRVVVRSYVLGFGSFYRQHMN